MVVVVVAVVDVLAEQPDRG